MNDDCSLSGGGEVKIESHKVNVKAKAKVGSLDNVGHEPGGGNVKVVINSLRGYYILETIPLSFIDIIFPWGLFKSK